MTGDIAELRARYRELILSWAAASAAPAEANRLFRKIQQMQKELRESEAGREVIGGLLDDEVVAVRLIAATHTLQWSAELAKPVLTSIEELGGSYSLDAEFTLREFQAGTLNLDW
jgi:hypothetical protein